MDSVRKAYQRAVQIPMDNVKRIWEEYQEFENNLNKITVRPGILWSLYSTYLDLRLRSSYRTCLLHTCKRVPF